MGALPSIEKVTTYEVVFGNQKINLRKPKVGDYAFINEAIADMDVPLYETALRLLTKFMVDGDTEEERRKWLEVNVEFDSLHAMSSSVFKLLKDLGMEVNEEDFLEKAKQTLVETRKKAKQDEKLSPKA